MAQALAPIAATSAQIELFIENLQRFPAIWNTSHTSYHNRIAKDAVWRELWELVGLPASDMKRTYQTIRKSYRTVSQLKRNSEILLLIY